MLEFRLDENNSESIWDPSDRVLFLAEDEASLG